MVRFGIVGGAVLLLSTAALGQGADSTHHRHRHLSRSAHHVAVAHPAPVQQQAWAQRPAQPDEATSAPRYHQDGNSCGPDHPVPVWGDGNAFLGYSCEGESANGS